MCSILARKRPLTWTTTADFYLRRLKRIVPLYLSVLLLVLLAVRRLISPIEFKQIVEEATPALGFYSNMPGMREAAYFDISSKLYFFLHTWSLSVEIQFYALVPLIFFAFDRLVDFRPSVQFLLILAVPVSSFVFQCVATGDRAHMLLAARIWQFFVGFAAHYSRARGLCEFPTHQSKNADNVEDDTNKWVDEAANLFLHSFLVLLLVFGLPGASQLGRLVIVVLVGVIVSRRNEKSWLSNWRPIVTLGDVSYSVYLIHWPLFTWHRYSNSEVYVEGGEPDLITGLILISASVTLGYVVENVFKALLRFIDGWTMLIVVLVFGFYLNGLLIYELRRSAIDLEAGAAEKAEDWIRKVRRDVRMLWTTRNQSHNYTHTEVTTYNAEMIHAYHSFAFCDNQDRTMPTNYPLNMSAYRQNVVFTCHATGEGTKNIVIIGNSHSVHNFPGIAYVFRQTYRRLTLFMRNSCLPTVRKFQQPGRSEADLDECMHLLNSTAPALREWKYPIDIVIALYALVDRPDVPLSVDMKRDEFLTSMKEFYSEIAEIPREVLIIQQSQPQFSQVAIQEVESRMKSGKPLDTIGDKPETLRNRASTLRTRMELLECPKCVKLDLISEWCNRTSDDFCHSTTDQGIIQFADKHHPSAVGSFYNAEYMRRVYRKFVG